ncbi:hypothetical protein R5R35_005276 [Gryllus longicercus]|uniref:Large ribosomal subunit protein bL9m n=1 Tax=Gryllus longicercus TaxID=2509291 RepID=A0AAN9W111_9ORTH
MTGYCASRLVTGVLGWNGHCLRAPSTVPLILQIRNTFILQRRTPPGLTKKNKRPKLRSRHYVYDLVEDTNLRKQENLNVILTSYVQGFGVKGDRVSVKPKLAYEKLLLPGLAVYATRENVKMYEESVDKEEKTPAFSSASVERTVGILSRQILAVVMNLETEWTLQPWHLRISFRKAGFIVPEYAIELPEEPIKGPNLDLEGKEFKITVTINKSETVPVRCRIHHWSTNPGDRLPYVQDHWQQTAEPLFPDNQKSFQSDQ